MKLKEISDSIGGSIVGNPEIDITGVSGIKEAQKGDITFLADKKNLKHVYSTNASAIIVREEIEGLSVSMLIVDNPYLAFARVLELFYKKPFKPYGISKEAFIGRDVNFGEEVSIYPMAYIGNNVSIGNRATVFPCVYIGDDVFMGDNSIVYPNVTIRENVKIGKNVIIHSGTVIGSDGFGYVQDKGRHHKIPQVGGVIIEDDVEIGASVTIDRATIGNTLIGSGTKIDNLVQIAHNVRIGKNCLIVAHVGIGGSVEIGDGVVLAGQVGVRDHVKIGSGVMVGAQSGIGHDIPDGQVFSGTPAIPHKSWLRAQSIYAKLPEYIKRLLELEKKLKNYKLTTEDAKRPEDTE
jgi:UDP-3-O-[3-hydroxymyristoyl] glucosamine N-acyltransferase